MRCVPKINGIYWLSLAFASLFGATVGGFLADLLGHVEGLPFLIVGIALVFVAERFLKHVSTVYFWAAIVLIRAAATNIGGLFHDYHIKFFTSVPLMCLVLAVMVIVWRTREPSTQEEGFIPVARYFWLTMFVACVLGTLAGDAASYPLGYGLPGAIVAFAVPLAFLLAIGRDGLYADIGFYWLTVLFISSAGTAAGELLTRNAIHSAEVGTLLSGAVFVALIVALYEKRSCNNHLQGQEAGEAAL